jgi:DNA-binding MarR family transcriptional regulator
MADINFERPDKISPAEEELLRGRELLFFAYRDYMSEPAEILQKYEFGPAHHRVVHFVGRKPGMTVSELLSILKITKQSLSRVLSALINQGFIRQEMGNVDRRQRLLYLSEKGAALEAEVSAPQRRRMARAYREAGPAAVQGFWQVLYGLIDEKDRDRLF